MPSYARKKPTPGLRKELRELLFDLVVGDVPNAEAEKQIIAEAHNDFERDQALSKWRICCGKISVGGLS